jgi:chemotaxis protein MotB
MAKPDDKKIIIINRRKKAHHGHHGGAWKVAYADFVTAMMAFFMVMWILGMDENLKRAVEGYFSNPIGFKKGYSSGQSPLSSGASVASMRREQVEIATREMQTRKFEKAAEHLRERIDSLKKTGSLDARIDIQVNADGLRIELVEDRHGDTFFRFGSSEMKVAGRIALSQIAAELAQLENPVIIEGHTDAAPYRRVDYGNWELSSDRANAARRIIVQEGLRSARIVEVTGMADRQLKYPFDPLNASNRRISIRLPFVLPPPLPEPGSPLRHSTPAG